LNKAAISAQNQRAPLSLSRSLHQMASLLWMLSLSEWNALFRSKALNAVFGA
jgi:hypothetical protein